MRFVRPIYLLRSGIVSDSVYLPRTARAEMRIYTYIMITSHNEKGLTMTTPIYPKQGARQRAWRLANPDKVQAQVARRKRTHAARDRAVRRAWRRANPAKMKAYRAAAIAHRAPRPALAGACAVCRVTHGLVRDRRRGGAICRPCLIAANILRTPERATALAGYLMLG